MLNWPPSFVISMSLDVITSTISMSKCRSTALRSMNSVVPGLASYSSRTFSSVEATRMYSRYFGTSRMPAYSHAPTIATSTMIPIIVMPRCLCCIPVSLRNLSDAGSHAVPEQVPAAVRVERQPDRLGLADDVVLGHVTDFAVTTVLAVVAVVAHHEVMARRHAPFALHAGPRLDQQDGVRSVSQPLLPHPREGILPALRPGIQAAELDP